MSWERRQRVQMLSRRGTPATYTVFFWMLALNTRLVLGALRSQRPECLCLMFRPWAVPFPQMSQRATELSFTWGIHPC